MPRTQLLKGSVPVSFRLSRQTHKHLAEQARREELSLSEFIRRALRREIDTGRRSSRHER